MCSNFTKNTETFDAQIDLIDQTLNNMKPVDPTEEVVYKIAKPIAKAWLYGKAIVNLFSK